MDQTRPASVQGPSPEYGLVAFEQGEFTANTIPGAELIILDLSGHLALLFSTETRANVVDFLEQHNQ